MNAVTVPSSDTNNVGNKWYSKIKATTKWNDVNTTVIGHVINFGSRNKGHYVWITGLTARLVNFAIFFRHEIDSSQYLEILRVSDLTRFFYPESQVEAEFESKFEFESIWVEFESNRVKKHRLNQFSAQIRLNLANSTLFLGRVWLGFDLKSRVSEKIWVDSTRLFSSILFTPSKGCCFFKFQY